MFFVFCVDLALSSSYIHALINKLCSVQMGAIGDMTIGDVAVEREKVMKQLET